MRIIAGTARSLPLKTIEGMDTRPTTDRIKETLFNMLQNDVPGRLRPPTVFFVRHGSPPPFHSLVSYIWDRWAGYARALSGG